MSSLVAGLGEETRSRANALADPTRFGIFRYVATAGHAATVAELTEYTGLNHNAVRQHLGVLVKAGLLDEGVHAAGTRGRPRLIYRVSPTAASDFLLSYERLAKVLVRAFSASMTPRDAGREEGIRDAMALEDSVQETSASEVLNRVMSLWGFATRFDHHEMGSDTVTLTSCPLAQAVGLDARVVCSVHLGVVEGVLEATGGSRLIGFDIHEPLGAGCEIALSN
ncbi:MAG: helix-turn-helix domain-containing protein [Actinomycetota bacterium]|nr:helix-turn-helix domain-containing protein [Actinomycetota bacterium]